MDMKRIIMTFAAAMVAAVSFAQVPGVIEKHPANSPEGKILTMEETIRSRELNPALPTYGWFRDGRGYTAVKDSLPRKFQPGISAFNRGNGLYIKDKAGKITAVAEDSDRNIVYGQIVSRNEFGIDKGIFWSPDSTRLAFYRKDESRVTTFPLLNIRTRTGELMPLKYPMAGMDSEILRLCVYDLGTGDSLHVKVTDFGPDRYLTGVTWSPDSRHIFIQVLDRSQKHMRLNMYDASTGEFERTVLTEDNEKYVEPLDPLYFVKGSDSRFIYVTANRDGYRSLYLCDTTGVVKRLSTGDGDAAYLDNDGRYVFYTSAEVSPAEKHLFRVDMKSGKKIRLTPEEGWHNISLSPDCRQFIDSFSSINNPGRINIGDTDGRKLNTLYTAEDPTTDYAYTEILFGTVKSADGKYDNHYRMVLPKDFDPEKKYPVILYVYGGPHVQLVQNRFLAAMGRWEMYMAQRGYIVYVQDNRGSWNRGLEYEQAIHRQCGQAEMADQMEGIKMLMDLPFVDRDRIGVHGWSYGGFMTISLITNYPEVFKVAVAGGPVIDWKWYEVMYGERYMETPQSNPEGYALTSLINKAASLEGKLLICQGAIDNTVVWQHCLSFIQKCIDNGVQLDFFTYPTAMHNMFGKERVHLMNKVTDYFETYLK